jgi:hypothetical protein
MDMQQLGGDGRTLLSQLQRMVQHVAGPAGSVWWLMTVLY